MRGDSQHERSQSIDLPNLLTSHLTDVRERIRLKTEASSLLGALDLLSGFAPGAGRRCQGRTVDALAQEAEEGRGKLR